MQRERERERERERDIRRFLGGIYSIISIDSCNFLVESDLAPEQNQCTDCIVKEKKKKDK